MDRYASASLRYLVHSFPVFVLRQCLTIAQVRLKLLDLLLPQSPQMNTIISDFSLFFISFFFPNESSLSLGIWKS